MAEQITREILELAAKAYGINLWFGPGGPYIFELVATHRWNPSTNPGDCADLEAACGIDVIWAWAEKKVVCGTDAAVVFASYADHPTKQAARMYASTMCAAEIGRNKK